MIRGDATSAHGYFRLGCQKVFLISNELMSEQLVVGNAFGISYYQEHCKSSVYTKDYLIWKGKLKKIEIYCIITI